VIVLGVRPSRIAADVEIDLPRPRSLDMISTDRFGELNKVVRKSLEVSLPAGEEH
jgi:NitT/TauT family transport system ATP-binding protein